MDRNTTVDTYIYGPDYLGKNYYDYAFTLFLLILLVVSSGSQDISNNIDLISMEESIAEDFYRRFSNGDIPDIWIEYENGFMRPPNVEDFQEFEEYAEYFDFSSP